jgi:hypothetical protein
MPVEWIEHRGKKILYSDFSNIRKLEDSTALLYVMEKKFREETMEKVRHMLNFENTAVSPEFMDTAKKVGFGLMPDAEKNAFVKVSPLKTVLLKGFLFFTNGTQKTKVFDSLEEAKDWLVK